jgi:hypothetical protein
MLYHATYQSNVESIMTNGLKINNNTKNWDFDYYKIYDVNPIFLAKDYNVAFDFAATAESVPEDIYNSGIVVLSIDEHNLDNNNLFVDCFNHSDFEAEEIMGSWDIDNPNVETLAYTLDIPANFIKLS